MKKAPSILWMTVLLVILLAGCDGHHDETDADRAGNADLAASGEAQGAELPEIVRTAITVAREIEADPANTEAILADHGLTAESFEEMLYDISGDPELSRAYNAALN